MHARVVTYVTLAPSQFFLVYILHFFVIDARSLFARYSDALLVFGRFLVSDGVCSPIRTVLAVAPHFANDLEVLLVLVFRVDVTKRRGQNNSSQYTTSSLFWSI